MSSKSVLRDISLCATFILVLYFSKPPLSVIRYVLLSHSFKTLLEKCTLTSTELYIYQWEYIKHNARKRHMPLRTATAQVDLRILIRSGYSVPAYSQCVLLGIDEQRRFWSDITTCRLDGYCLFVCSTRPLFTACAIFNLLKGLCHNTCNIHT